MKDEKKGMDETILGSMPDAGSTGKETEKPGPTDYWGRPFDPTLHVVDEQGSPVLTTKGKLRVQKGKGLKASQIGKGEKVAIYTQTGVAAAEAIFMVGRVIGPEWEPTPNEHTYMSHAWTEYFKAKGVKDLPPGIVLGIALISYAGPRFATKETQSRMKKAASWIVSRFKRKKPAIVPVEGPEGVQ